MKKEILIFRSVDTPPQEMEEKIWDRINQLCENTNYSPILLFGDGMEVYSSSDSIKKVDNITLDDLKKLIIDNKITNILK